MTTANLKLNDLTARADRIEAILHDPAADKSFLNEACADTPIVGELLVSVTFAHPLSVPNSTADRQDARSVLAVILALREIEREAVFIPAMIPQSPVAQTTLDGGVLVNIGNCLGCIGASAQEVFRILLTTVGNFFGLVGGFTLALAAGFLDVLQVPRRR